MSTANLLFKSSTTRTIATILGTVIAFFMIPFVITRLGDKWYGVWTIVGSLTSYYYMIDFGLATAVTRYVTEHIAKNDNEKANEIINTSFVIYCVMAFVICAITIVVAVFADVFITNKVELHVVRLVVLIMGFNLASEFPFKAFSGIIGAYIRYDLLTYSHFCILLLNTGLYIYFLRAGHGILTLALIGFGTSQVSNMLYYAVSRHLFKEMRFGRQYFRREKIGGLFGYSVWSFVIQLGDQLRFKLDSVVIAWMMAASYVTHYAIGAGLASYFVALVFRATNILTPVFTKYHAQNNYEEIRSKLMFMTKLNTVLCVFGGGWTILVGRSFIARWMGANYLDAYPVLVALVVAMIAEGVHNPSSNVLYGISKHRYLGVVNIIEGAANFVLSLLLVRHLGIVGVALGTTIPLIISRVFVLPAYVCRSIGLPVGKYYASLVTTTAYTVGFLALSFAVTRSILAVPQYKSIFVVSVLGSSLYVLSVFFVAFNKTERALLKSMLGGRFG